MRLENLFIAALENDFNDKEINLSPKIKPIREVSSDCKKEFKEELLLIQPGGDQVPSAGHHVGGWVIFSPKNTVSTWY